MRRPPLFGERPPQHRRGLRNLSGRQRVVGVTPGHFRRSARIGQKTARRSKTRAGGAGIVRSAGARITRVLLGQTRTEEFMRSYDYVIGRGQGRRGVSSRADYSILRMRRSSCSKQVGRTKASTASRIRHGGARTSAHNTTGPTVTSRARTCSGARFCCRWERFWAGRAASTACCGPAVTGPTTTVGPRGNALGLLQAGRASTR